MTTTRTLTLHSELFKIASVAFAGHTGGQSELRVIEVVCLPRQKLEHLLCLFECAHVWLLLLFSDRVDGH